MFLVHGSSYNMAFKVVQSKQILTWFHTLFLKFTSLKFYEHPFSSTHIIRYVHLNGQSDSVVTLQGCEGP
jgi:hypothetical protein